VRRKGCGVVAGTEVAERQPASDEDGRHCHSARRRERRPAASPTLSPGHDHLAGIRFRLHGEPFVLEQTTQFRV
jgi:hypothetical protein